MDYWLFPHFVKTLFYELSVSARYMACLLHLVLFVVKSRTKTLSTAHFSEYRDSYIDMLVNSSLLRCHDTYLCNAELY